MGLLDRLHDSLTGLGSAIQAPAGLVKDLAVAPFDDEDDGGIIGTIYRSSTNRFGQSIGGLLGPEGTTGALIGGLPETLRQPVAAVYNPAVDTMEAAYSELVSQPLSTAFTAGSLADAPGGGGIAGLFNPETWAEAYNIAEHRSPGQSIALAFTTKDIKNPREVQKAQGSDFFNIASGTFDAATRIFADPTTYTGGKAATGWKALHDVSTVDAIARAEQAGRIAKFADRLVGMSAAEIRHTYFPKHAQGADIAHVLAEAENATDMHRTLRILMGATDEVDALRESRAALALRLDELMQERAMVKSLSANGFALANDTEDIANLTAALDELYPEAVRLERLYQSRAAIQKLPVLGPAETRARITSTTWYQQSATAKPLRVVFDMQPHRFVRLDDPTGDVQLWRMLQKSDLPLERQQQIRSAYMAANSPGGRLTILDQAQDEAINSIAQSAGMTADDVNRVLNEGRKRRGQIRDKINSRAYDGQGRSRVLIDDEDGTAIELNMVEQPLWETQLPEVTTLDDMDEVRRATKKLGQWRLRHPAADMPEEWLTKFYKVWRPATLLRMGWPLRVIGDEQMRLMAKLGTLTSANNLRAAFGDWKTARGYNKLAKAAKEEAAELGLVGDEAAAHIRSVLEGAKAPRLLRSFEHKGYTLEGPYGSPGDGWNYYRDLTSARASFSKVLGETGDDLDELYKSGQWSTLTPDAPGYAEAWTHAVNHQIGQSALARKIIEAEGDQAAVVRWLQSTPEGQRVRAQLPFRRNLEEWVAAGAEQIDAYLPTAELKAAALKRNATFGELEALFPDAGARPNVHGELLDQALGTSQTSRMLQKFTDRGFATLSTIPSDQLSRSNFFDKIYRAEVKRRIDLDIANGYELTVNDLADIQHAARNHALGEVKELLYDLAEESRLSDMLRFLSPFYSAWQEVITRWGGLAVENPAFVRRAQLVWQAPDKAGLVQDEHGNTVNERGIITHAVEGYQVGQKSPSSERLIVFPIGWFHNIPGLQEGGKVSFPKASMNLALSGVPGAGPVAAVPVNAIAKERPEIADSVKFILPFGATQDWMQLMWPSWFKRAKVASEGEDNRSFAFTMFRLYNDRMVDYNLGKREKPPTYDEVKREAQAFHNLNTAASWFSPVSLSAKSPYQFYIDALRGRKEWDATLTPEQREDPNYMNPEDWFLTTYGDEYFPLTQSLSRSIDGVPPTLEGKAARAKYQSLIEADPELGRLIIGEEGAGEFNRSVYEAQLSTRVAPGSELNQREVDSFETFAARGPTALGWKRYGEMMDAIDLARVQRGLPSLNVKGAEDLREAKQATIEWLANDPQFTGWYEDYASSDRAKWDKRINGMKKIADSPLFSDDRRDIAGLREYLAGREAVVAALAAAESKSLSARSNVAIATSWDMFVSDLVERNPAFAALYYRWLENDPVILTPITAAATQGMLA